MNLITPGSLSWAAFLEMGARLENSPNPSKPRQNDGAFISQKSSSDYLKGDICLLTFVINGLDGAIGEGDDELA